MNIVSKLSDETIKFEILKSFAELCIHYHSSGGDVSLNNLYDLLLAYLPKPLEKTEQEAKEEQEEAKFNFSYVECLLFSFHSLAKHHTQFLNSEENKERLKEFRLRLQYSANGTQCYIKELRNSLSNTSITTKENEEV